MDHDLQSGLGRSGQLLHVLSTSSMVRYKYRTPGHAQHISFVALTALVAVVAALSGMIYALLGGGEREPAHLAGRVVSLDPEREPLGTVFRVLPSLKLF